MFPFLQDNQTMETYLGFGLQNKPVKTTEVWICGPLAILCQTLRKLL